MSEIYESPLSSRYASAYMLKLFSPDTRCQTWRRLWAALAQAENDFVPLLLALQSTGSSSWIIGMHLPATYGAWMTAMGSAQLPVE